MTRKDVQALVAKRATEAGGMAALAARWGVSRIYLYQIVSGDRPPGPAVLKPLGLRRVMSLAYEPSPK